MESKTGSLLTLVAAIINFVFAGLALIITIVLPIIILKGYGEIETNLSRELLASLAGVFFFILTALIVLLGFLLLQASKKMKNPKTTRNGAIWAIILGALTLGYISGILALIGGIIGLIDADKKK